jgi:hypothetical protein
VSAELLEQDPVWKVATFRAMSEADVEEAYWWWKDRPDWSVFVKVHTPAQDMLTTLDRYRLRTLIAGVRKRIGIEPATTNTGPEWTFKK